MAQGTSNTWHWQKYSSGLAICYGTFSITSTINTSLGNGLYESASLGAQPLPFVFAETPMFIPARRYGGYNGAWITGFETSSIGDTDETPQVCLLRGTAISGSGTYYIGWFVIGRWK